MGQKVLEPQSKGVEALTSAVPLALPSAEMDPGHVRSQRPVTWTWASAVPGALEPAGERSPDIQGDRGGTAGSLSLSLQQDLDAAVTVPSLADVRGGSPSAIKTEVSGNLLHSLLNLL